MTDSTDVLQVEEPEDSLPETSFDEIPQALRDACGRAGWSSLMPVQAKSLPYLLSGRDLMVQSRTGSGKTGAFVLPILDKVDPSAKVCQALVLAPTRELALQVARELGWLYEQAGARIATCVGGMDYRTERRALERGAHIVVGTPGRLRDHIERGSLDLTALRACVLDEADEMLDLGFREDLEFILGSAPEERRTLMFSATVPPAIEALARDFQRDALRIQALGEARQHGDIDYRALSVTTRDREHAIFNTLRFYEASRAIIFCKTRANVNHLLARMGNRGFKVVALSGELSQQERSHALQALRDGRARWFPSQETLLAQFPGLAADPAAAAQKALAVLPLDAGTGIFGVMTLGYRDEREFPADDRALAFALAGQFAQALERARLYEAERDARRRAETANRAKSEFLARMSHDLRTPLNAIGGYAELVEIGLQGPVTTQQVDAMQRVRRAKDHLLTLINDILSFAKLEAGQVTISIEAVDVRDVVREVHAFVERRSAPQGGTGSDDTEALDHLWVMLDQCNDQVARFRRRGAGSLGSSANASHLIERLEETLKRIERLIVLIGLQYRVAGPRTALRLWQELLLATAERDSIRAVWKKSTRMVSRSVTQNKSDHGEHYISRDLPSYLRLIATAAGAGVVIAVMALIKITIESWELSPLPQAVLVSLNYGLGFVLVHLLHFTIATKQPAVTAASFAAEVERNRHGKALGRKLARLLRDVNRSQWGAVWGNVSAALATALVITAIALAVSGQALLSGEQITSQLKAISPLHSLALFYAAIAGVWLFCAGIMAGFFDNRADHIRLERRLIGHPALQWLSPGRRERLAHYLHHNYGALAGNFLFGVLLGMTGYLGLLLGLPLDIRHVAFSSANLGFASFSDFQGWVGFLVGLLCVMMIGFVNLWVSFALALMVALRSRGCRIEPGTLLSGVKEEFLREPLRFFLPRVRSSRKGDTGELRQDRH